MKSWNGAASLVLEACIRVWAVRWILMTEVPEFEAWSSGIKRHLKKLEEAEEARSSTD
jgi:hypothetical protein